MKIELRIPNRRIADLMVSVIEGNDMTRAWCMGVRFLSARFVADNYDKRKGYWYDRPELFNGRFTIEVTEFGDKEGEDKVHILTADKVKRGLRLMALKHPRHFGDFMSENDDAITADVFFQLCVLGDVVYG